jgi:glycine/D-amino acid oxidase-like deaminating enzyme/nitrite reductase/ring-hydroxylating ferredoxin subunit
MKYNTSLWEEYKSNNSYPRLESDISADVLVIGGGMSGITCAAMLKSRNISTTLIEAKRIINGVSSNTTAKITSQHDIRLNEILNKSGFNKAKMYAQANENAIEYIENTVTRNNIECGFKKTYACVITEREDKIKSLESEYEAAVRLGINAEMMLNPEFNATKNAEIEAALKFFNQAHFNPVPYLDYLAQNFCDNDKYRIYENTRAVDIIKDNHKPYKVITDNGVKISAHTIVIATHFPFFDKRGLYFTKLYPSSSYIYSFTAEDGFNEGMFITAEEGYSLRSYIHNGENVILIAGENHDTAKGGYFEKHYQDLKKKAEQLFKVNKFMWKWFAQDYATPDKLPYAGILCKSMPNVYVMTGYDKWGMTNSTAAAKIVSDKIAEGRSPCEEAFSPQRIFRSFYYLGNYFYKNFKTVFTLIGGRLKRLPHRSNIKKDESRLMKINGIRVGIYRDNDGVIHTVKSTCRHMGCQLYFNDAEKTWDCPCHGSRYDIDGNIIEGPATKPLHKFSKDSQNDAKQG